MQHESQGKSREHDSVRGVHEARTKQHPHRVQVIRCLGHNVAGARTLIKAVGETFQMLEKIVSEIEFNFAGDSNQTPANQELEDGLGSGS